jgi:dethiobiotin synthetase
MAKSIFITATGTDVGKTYISGLLVKKMRDAKLNCGYYKPALSGAIRQSDGSLLPGDCDFVLRTAKLNKNPLDCVTYCFEEAVSPHLAAIRQGVKIEPKKILSDFEKISKDYDFMVVEGAGGITCPFNLNNETLLLPDIIKTLDLDSIIVADGGLGTINSVLLTTEYAKAHDINIRGIIFNNYDSENFMHQDNLRQVERLTGIKVITTVKKGDTELEISKENLLKIFEK